MPDTRDPQSVILAAEQAAVGGDYASAERLLREAAEPAGGQPRTAPSRARQHAQQSRRRLRGHREAARGRAMLPAGVRNRGRRPAGRPSVRRHEQAEPRRFSQDKGETRRRSDSTADSAISSTGFTSSTGSSTHRRRWFSRRLSRATRHRLRLPRRSRRRTAQNPLLRKQRRARPRLQRRAPNTKPCLGRSRLARSSPAGWSWRSLWGDCSSVGAVRTGRRRPRDPLHRLRARRRPPNQKRSRRRPQSNLAPAQRRSVPRRPRAGRAGPAAVNPTKPSD